MTDNSCLILLKPAVEIESDRICTKKARGAMHIVCLVTTQSFNEGSLDMETFAFASSVRGYHVQVYRDVWKPSIGENLVAKREFNNPMVKHVVKVQ